MKYKVVRLSKALTNETVKRLPWVALVFLVLLFVQFVRFNAQTAENTRIAKSNSVDSKVLLMQVAQLSEDNKRLTQQAIDLSKLNTEQQKCFFNIFVDSINLGTRPKRADVDNCTTRVIIFGQAASTSGKSSAQLSLSSQSASSSQPTPSTPTPQPNILPKTVDCKVDVLFIHIAC